MAIPLPDRFKKKPLMTPPGKKGITVAIGIGKPKPGEDDALKPGADPMADDNAPAMSPAAAGGAPHAEPDKDDSGDVMTPEEAIVLRADSKTCQSCKNWGETDGSCSVVPEGAPYDAGDRCLRGYEPDDMGEADDAGAGAPPMPPGGAGQ